MRYKQFQGVIEREYNKSLKKVMYEICIEEGLSAVEGAKKLGLAKEVFLYWRHYYRFDKDQLLFDEIAKRLSILKEIEDVNIQGPDIKRPFSITQEESLQGFEEIIIQMIECYQDLEQESEGLSSELGTLPLHEFSLDLLKSYQNGTLDKNEPTYDSK